MSKCQDWDLGLQLEESGIDFPRKLLQKFATINISGDFQRQNTRLAFLERNNPTPLILDILAHVDATILGELQGFAENVQLTRMANGQ